MELKLVLQWVLAAFMVFAGIAHFAVPKGFVKMVPKWLPAPAALVAVSGVFEVLGGVGLMLPATQRFAAWGLVALFVAVFPANANMALHKVQVTKKPLPAWVLWARLPLQPVFMAWAWWYT